ncbi:MAG: RdgB/HAM1 family non-canonical purine NTP pyrophosphatase [Burkholderiaceae bacterium]
MAQCVVASGNQKKLRELSTLLVPFGYETVSQAELGISPPPEPHPTFVENALVKARHASALSGLPAIADDSGICVRVLGGAPGVYSARYAERAGAGSGDADNNAHLMAELLAKPGSETGHGAYYVAVLVWLEHADDPLPVVAQGLWHGLVVSEPAGEGGFGYDPHFYLPSLGKTAAQLSAAEKNAISHRGQAMTLLREQLQARFRSVQAS